MANPRKVPEPGVVEMRDAYCATMIELGRADKRIMVLDDDCSHSMGTAAFREALPEQYLNPGIMEAHIVGMATGLSNEGFIPFINAFGAFAARRAFDQIFLSCGYAGLNVKILGWDAGIAAAANGGTHMPFEDMGLIRNIPSMVVVEPADTTAFSSLLRAAAAHEGNVYMRMLRRGVSEIYEPGGDFSIGKAELVREGGDVTIIACGFLVAEALAAATMLMLDGISARVVDMHTIKPLDETMVLECAERTGAIVTAENHNYSGGLSAAVAQCLAARRPTPQEWVAVEEQYGEVGNMDYLKKRFRLDREHIVEKAKTAISRKQRR